MDGCSCHCTGGRDKDHLKKKKWKKPKWLSEEGLKIVEIRREVKGKGERERYTQLNAELQRIVRRDELLNAKFRLQLKKAGKTSRSFRYDLNQIPYDYTVEVKNRFKGLDLIDRVPEELWTEVRDIVQKAVIKIIPNRKKCKKAKCCLRRPYK